MTLGGCSGGPAPRAWAASVCTVLEPWRTEIGTLTTRTQQQMTAATTPAQAKENLMRLFGGAETASEKARAGVEKAGVPDVDEGKQVADGFTASLGAMRDAYGRARTGIEGAGDQPAKDLLHRGRHGRGHAQHGVRGERAGHQQAGLGRARSRRSTRCPSAAETERR